VPFIAGIRTLTPFQEGQQCFLNSEDPKQRVMTFETIERRQNFISGYNSEFEDFINRPLLLKQVKGKEK
jgi:hypothetical protein